MTHVQNIPIAKLLADNTYRYRRDLDVAALAKSIASKGQQVPLIVRKTSAGLQLISGFRRVAAMQNLNIESAKAVIKHHVSDLDAIGISLLENLERATLGELDKVLTAVRLTSEGLSTKDVAESFGVTPRTIQRYLVVGSPENEPWHKLLAEEHITIQQAYEGIRGEFAPPQVVGRSVSTLRREAKIKRGGTSSVFKVTRKQSGEYDPQDHL